MKVICIGRNYEKHANELNNPLPKEPMFFMKPDVAILKENTFYYPDFTKDLHYECEVVVRIEKVGKNIEEKFAHNYYSSITIGIDFTARDLQEKCKENRHPWEISKSFENSAPIGSKFISIDNKNIQDISFKLLKNGEIVQIGNTKDMIFNVDYMISYISQFMTLKTGDLIFTGTPEGVGPVSIGDYLEGFINEEKVLNLRIK